MNNSNTFLIDLNDASIEEKKKYFIERTANHPLLSKTYLEIREKIRESAGGKIYLVYGPTGVGKSTLYNKLKNTVTKSHQMTNVHSSLIPIVGLELPAPDNGKFNWKDFYRRILREMNEPLIDKKIKKDHHPKKFIPNYLPSTAPELRESLENSIIYRETKIILLDEAQHLLKVASGKNIQDQMDALKSIANLTGAIIVMFGTYELMDFFDLNGQLGRRTEEIHFPRYNINVKEEADAFINVIATFQTHIPLKNNSDLSSHWEFLYERSIGCIGILKEWLDNCVKEALNNNENSITIKLLEKHAPTPKKVLKIANEVLDGEKNVKDMENQRSLLRDKLGLNKLSKVSAESSKKKGKDVGKRNPTRDIVGIVEDGA
ncbi:energy-coupling factor transporter ATP-binding protein EcfA2 [Metabacillus crassostreae]|uniref:AAA family ATPase n=1 Tax=Metabacillus crassostreae TaxID=929098 RepID=UPI00195EA238|nr:AAA family ATPase [Metabacillus crassostreae]MBM7605937.1 energy-coupling factor transporter ATP-binding protein EcfA2 [Metabacillus crassostreae]